MKTPLRPGKAEGGFGIHHTEDNRHGKTMVSPLKAAVNTGEDWWVRCKSVLQSKAPAYPIEVSLEFCYQAPEYHLGSRWYSFDPSSPDSREEYRYWPVIDFDDKEDPKKALKEAYSFVIAELDPLGLKPGRDYCVAVSGTKGAKVFFLWLSPPGSDGAQVWGSYLKSLSESYSTLDAQTAWAQTFRGPWSRHPKDKTRWQTVLHRHPSVFVADPDWCLLQTRVGDRPAFDTWRESLPKTERPTNAFSSLWERASSKWLEAQVSSAQRPRRHYEARKMDIGGVLAANSIGSRECMSWSGDRYWRVSSCIFCGAKGKAAIKERSGFYDCYRGSCKATSGLPLSSWTDGLVVPDGFRAKATGVYVRTLPLRKRTGPPRANLLAARTKLMEEISQAVDNPQEEPVLLRCTPGLGKSHTVLSVLTDRIRDAFHKGEKLKVVVGTQTRELARELMERTNAFDFPMVVKRVFVEGRNEENCSFPRQIRTIGALGWSPGKAFCPSCPYMGECAYYRRVKDAADKFSMVFTTHEQASSMIDNEIVKPDLVVFDEDPLRSMEHPLSLGIRDIRRSAVDRPEPVEAAGALLLSVMQSALPLVPPNGSIELRGPALVERLDALWEQVRTSDDRGWRDVFIEAVALAPMMEPTGGVLAGATTATIRALLPRNFFRLLEQLVREGKRTEPEWNSPCRLVVKSSGIIYWEATFRIRPASFLPDLVLDAYGDRTLYENLFGAPFKEVHIRAELERSRFWYVPVRTSREALSDKTSAAWTELERVVASLEKTGRVLVGTYLAFAAEVKKRFPEVELYHFGRGRGIDTYGDIESVVLFGVPQPPEQALFQRSTFYFQDDSSPISMAKHPDNPRLFADVRVQRTMDAMRESEAAQVAHRVRPVNAARNIVSMGLVDYPTLPEPAPFPKSPHAPHIAAMEQWVSNWFETHGWFTPALIGEKVCPLEPIPKRAASKLWRKLFPTGRRSLSPDRRLSARPVWGDREAAREWARGVAREQGIEDWESI